MQLRQMCGISLGWWVACCGVVACDGEANRRDTADTTETGAAAVDSDDAAVDDAAVDDFAVDSDDAAVGDAAVDTDDTTTTPTRPRVRFFVDESPHLEGGEVEATAARWGDPIRVVIDRMPAGTGAVVRSYSAAGASEAFFVADGEGVIDFARDAPLDGDWTEADADAFLGTLRNPPDGFDPLVIVVVEIDGVERARKTLDRHTIGQDVTVEYFAVGDKTGVFARPKTGGPFGAVMCFGRAELGQFGAPNCASYYAGLGYAAFGVRYFGTGSLPPSLDDVPLEILEGQLALLLDQPEVAPGGVVVIGDARDGELALLLGARFDAVSAVVARLPSGYVWPGAESLGAAWTWQGEPVASLPWTDASPRTGRSSENVVGAMTRSLYEDVLDDATPEELAAATIPIEQIEGPVLLFGAEDDQVWPSCTLAEVAWKRLEGAHAQTWGDLFVCHPGAGHAAAALPGSTGIGSTWASVGNTKRVLGGTPGGNVRAQRAIDTATRALLDRVLGPGRIVPPSSAEGPPPIR